MGFREILGGSWVLRRGFLRSVTMFRALNLEVGAGCTMGVVDKRGPEARPPPDSRSLLEPGN